MVSGGLASQSWLAAEIVYGCSIFLSRCDTAWQVHGGARWVELNGRGVASFMPFKSPNHTIYQSFCLTCQPYANRDRCPTIKTQRNSLKLLRAIALPKVHWVEPSCFICLSGQMLPRKYREDSGNCSVQDPSSWFTAVYGVTFWNKDTTSCAAFKAICGNQLSLSLSPELVTFLSEKALTCEWLPRNYVNWSFASSHSLFVLLWGRDWWWLLEGGGSLVRQTRILVDRLCASQTPSRTYSKGYLEGHKRVSERRQISRWGGWLWVDGCWQFNFWRQGGKYSEATYFSCNHIDVCVLWNSCHCLHENTYTSQHFIHENLTPEILPNRKPRKFWDQWFCVLSPQLLFWMPRQLLLLENPKPP